MTKELGFTKVVTHTTRKKRQGESEGNDYYFETATSFWKHHYLEFVQYDGNYYGSSLEGLAKALRLRGRAVIVLDTAGAQTYLQQLPNAKITVIFLELPTKQAQAKRLQARGDDPQKITQRLASAEAKRDVLLPKKLREKAHVIVNAELNATYAQLTQLVADVLD